MKYMFKKIISLFVFFSVISFGVCNAWEPPNGWEWFYSNDINSYYYRPDRIERIIDNNVKKCFMEVLTDHHDTTEPLNAEYYSVNTYIINCSNGTFKETSMRIHNKANNRIEDNKMEPLGSSYYPIKTEYTLKLLKIALNGKFTAPKPLPH